MPDTALFQKRIFYLCTLNSCLQFSGIISEFETELTLVRMVKVQIHHKSIPLVMIHEKIFSIIDQWNVDLLSLTTNLNN